MVGSSEKPLLLEERLLISGNNLHRDRETSQVAEKMKKMSTIKKQIFLFKTTGVRIL